MKPMVCFITSAASLNLFASTAMAEAPKLPTEIEAKDITFHVSLVRTAEGESLKIAFTGQGAEGEPTLVPIKGKLKFLEAADLKNDGLPEIYLAVTPEDPKMMSQLVAFVTDREKGLVRVSFTPCPISPKLEFRGDNRFSIKSGHLIHHVALYRQTDQDGSPSASREDMFGLSATESSAWTLIAVRSKAGVGRAKKNQR